MAPTHGSSSEGSWGRTRKPAGETPPLPPSQAQEGRPWAWLVAPRGGAAGQVAKPEEGSLNSAVSSPQSTAPCDPHGRLARSQATLSPASLCIRTLGAPGALPCDGWGALRSRVAWAERGPPPQVLFCWSRGSGFHSCQRRESPVADCSVPWLGFRIAFFFLDG